MKSFTNQNSCRELTSATAAFAPPGKRAHRFLFNSLALVAYAEYKEDDGDRPPPPPPPPDTSEGMKVPVTTDE